MTGHDNLKQNEEPGGNVEHVLANYEDADVSRASGLPCVFGYTPDGTYILTVREIEYGRDAKLSNVPAVAKVLGLRLELVSETE